MGWGRAISSLNIFTYFMGQIKKNFFLKGGNLFQGGSWGQFRSHQESQLNMYALWNSAGYHTIPYFNAGILQKRDQKDTLSGGPPGGSRHPLVCQSSLGSALAADGQLYNSCYALLMAQLLGPHYPLDIQFCPFTVRTPPLVRSRLTPSHKWIHQLWCH